MPLWRPVVPGDLLSLMGDYRKYQFLDQTYMLGALDFKGLEILGAQLPVLEHNLAYPFKVSLVT